VSSKPKYVLVTPVWNDSDRLEIFGRQLAEALIDAGMDIQWVIADDGSSPCEVDRLRALQESFVGVYPNVALVHLEDRSRKGGAVRQAWDVNPKADYYCFVDGDGAISAEVMIQLMRKASEALPAQVSFVGVRQLDAEENFVERTWLRRLFFHGFSMVVRLLLNKQWVDTQCGAKVIHGESYRSIRSFLVETGFVFDAELLAYLSHSGYEIEEVPIPWREVPGSKISLLTDSFRILFGLIRVRTRLKAISK
jgi:glycosyltransferase involved in cell wall biosynthesis